MKRRLYRGKKPATRSNVKRAMPPYMEDQEREVERKSRTDDLGYSDIERKRALWWKVLFPSAVIFTNPPDLRKEYAEGDKERDTRKNQELS